MNNKNLMFITWLRAASTVMILLCHFCAQSNVAIVRMTSQILNIGVELFFIISGFLVGYKGINEQCGWWYFRRIKRIYIPFWMFLLLLMIIHRIKGINILTKDWIFLILGLQGSVVGVWGAEQTWFISVLLLCYALTPAILHLLRHVEKVNLKWLMYFSVSILPVAFALHTSPSVSTILIPVMLYTIACAYGIRYKKKDSFLTIDIRTIMTIIVAAFIVRFCAKIYIDGTILYDRIIVPYTQAFAAFAIVSLFDWGLKNREVPRIVCFISDISYEIYLYHYMFTAGPVRLFGYTSNWITDCAVITCIVLVVAFCSNRLQQLFSKVWFLHRC